LEEQIGISLFDRTTRRVELTTYGAAFLPVAERIIRDLESSMTAMRAMHDGSGGRVSMASIGSIASSLLPLALESFKANYPDVDIEVGEDHSEGVRRKVLEGEIEFGLSGVSDPIQDVEARPFFADPVGVFCRIDNPLARIDKRLCWADLNGMEIFNMGYDTHIRTVADVAPDIALTLSSTSYKIRNALTALSLIHGSGIVAALPRLAIPSGASNDIIFLPLCEPEIHREIFLCRHVRTTLSAAALALIASISSSAQQAGATLHPMAVA
jgi:DNA-binding transcriptional LysR family regulator